MPRATFFEFVNLVAKDPVMATSPDAFMEALPVEVQIAVAVYMRNTVME